MASKYKAKKEIVDNIVFDSKVEARYYTEVVKPMLASGQLYAYKVHPKYILQQKNKELGLQPITYEADFELIYPEPDKVEVIDIKGLATETAKLKRKMFIYNYSWIPLKWIVWNKKYGGWCDYFEVIKKRKNNKTEG